MPKTTIDQLDAQRQELLQGAEELKAQRQEYSDLYNGGKPLTMSQLSTLSAIRQNSTDVEADTQRFAQANLISQYEGIDFASAWENVDRYNLSLLGQEPEYTKTRTTAIKDRYRIGWLVQQRADKCNE